MTFEVSSGKLSTGSSNSKTEKNGRSVIFIIIKKDTLDGHNRVQFWDNRRQYIYI